MKVSILVCLGAFLVLLWLLRRNRISLGLPIAYLFSLLLIHVPGALAHEVSGDLLPDSNLTAIGIRLAAIGSVCYVLGVWLARPATQGASNPRLVDRHRFCLFCVIGGWGVTYALGPLRHFASLGASIEQGGFIWMLGVILGLREALQRGDLRRAGLWLAAMAVYPALMLVSGGFLSWGSMTAIIVLSALTVSTRSYQRVAIVITVTLLFGISAFVNYFQHRTEIRDQVWGGASIEARVGVVADAFAHFEWFDSTNPLHLDALDQRLNQNYFVGLAAERIQRSEVDYLYGATVWDALLGLVPRALWPEKPVSVGSGRIVANLTGLKMSETTAFGVGNVMEFYINFGTPGLVIGFVLLGWVTGTLDFRAAVAERRGDLNTLIVTFLPAVTFISPNGSLVDLSTGCAAGLVAALGWSQVWKQWSKARSSNSKRVTAVDPYRYESAAHSS